MCRTPRIAELPNFPLGNILKDIAAHNRDTGLVREPRVLQNRFSVPSHKGFSSVPKGSPTFGKVFHAGQLFTVQAGVTKGGLRCEGQGGAVGPDHTDEMTA